MSRIDKLIAKHCPNGIEFKKLGEAVTLQRGKRLVKSQLEESGDFAVYQNSLTPLGYYNESNVKADTTFVVCAGAAGEIGYSDTDFWAADDVHILLPPDHIESKFLYYFLLTQQHQIVRQVRRASIPRLSKTVLEKLRIPVPPLEVQQEIVAVLDRFTKLEAELEAELEARRKQYQHYRGFLLSFDDASIAITSKQASKQASKQGWVTLDKISTNFDSKRRPVTKSARQSGNIPYYGASGIVDYVSDYIFDGDYLLISEDGANLLARSTPIAFSISGKTWVNNHAHVLEFDSYAERRFVEYYLNSINLSPFISGAAQPKLNKANLNKIPIPAVPVDAQKRIVSILDKFDALVNDLSAGLPAEINARRQQYEYYRDRFRRS